MKKISLLLAIVFTQISCGDVETVSSAAKTAQDVEASQIFTDFQTNEVAASNKYGGRIIAVRGIVAKIEKYGEGAVVLLNDGNQENVGIKCYFNSSEGLLNLKPGAPVKIKGVGTESLFTDYIVEGCVIAELGKP